MPYARTEAQSQYWREYYQKKKARTGLLGDNLEGATATFEKVIRFLGKGNARVNDGEDR